MRNKVRLCFTRMSYFLLRTADVRSCSAKHDAFLASFRATSCINCLHVLLVALLAATSRSYHSKHSFFVFYGTCFHQSSPVFQIISGNLLQVLRFVEHRYRETLGPCALNSCSRQPPAITVHTRSTIKLPCHTLLVRGMHKQDSVTPHERGAREHAYDCIIDTTSAHVTRNGKAPAST